MNSLDLSAYGPFFDPNNYDKLRIIAPFVSSDIASCNELRVIVPYISRTSEFTCSMMTYSDTPFAKVNGIPHINHYLLNDCEIAALINSGGVFFNTYRNDNEFNIHVLRAMACGVPVATVKTGLLDQYLVDNVNCLMNKSKDCWNIAKNIWSILNDINLAARLAAGGFELLERLGYNTERSKKIFTVPIKTQEKKDLDMSVTYRPKLVAYLADYSGCGYYRVRVPYTELQKQGFDVIITSFMHPADLDWADVVVFQRQHNDTILEGMRYSKGKGKLTIYELDDFLHGIPRSNPAYFEYPPQSKPLNNIISFIKETDCMIVSTKGMVEEYGRYAKTIFVAKNSIDKDSMPLRQNLKNDGLVRIGWAGSITHFDDIRVAISALEQIMEEYPNVRFCMLGADWSQLFKESLRERLIHSWGTYRKAGVDPFSKNVEDINTNGVTDYYKILAEQCWDIGIAPVCNTRFNNCKSDIKALEYSMLRIPLVASKVGEYKTFYEESDGGAILASKHIEWYKALKKLITSEEFREELSNKAYRYVIERRTIQSTIYTYKTIIENMLAIRV